MTLTQNIPSPALGADGMERRHVAVLFADITGFTALVESVDAELVYRIVRPLMDELVRRVHLHGGEIQQVLGDGFMAVFGLHAHVGDAPHQAIAAGLALVSAAADAGHPPVHVGIEYGEVLVTSAWDPSGFAVWGRTVNLASRLCDLAGPGTVQIGPVAYARAGRGLRTAMPTITRPKGFRATTKSYAVTPQR